MTVFFTSTSMIFWGHKGALALKSSIVINLSEGQACLSEPLFHIYTHPG